MLLLVAGVVLRLQPAAGSTYEYVLRIERPASHEHGELHERIAIRKKGGDVIMHIALTGLTIDGRDRTKDLEAIIGRQTVDLPWTEFCNRSGEMSPLDLKPGDPKVMSYLAEAGIYAGSFVTRAVSPAILGQAPSPRRAAVRARPSILRGLRTGEPGG